jgi:hypothetical protein
MIPKQTQEKLNAIAEQRSKELFQRAYDVLSRDQLVNTGELRDSLKITWFKATDTTPPRILLRYELQGFLLGLKKMSWVKVPNLDKLKKWAEGNTFSGPIPGYKSGTNLPPWKVKERIINAIAFDKRRNDTWKAKPWKGRQGINIGELLHQINQDTLQAWAKDVEQILADAISNQTDVLA